MRPERGGTMGWDDRGQANVLGVALIIGITVAGTTAVLALGSDTLSEARSDAEVESAEHALTKLDSTASLVALGESSSQRAVVSLRGTEEHVRVEEDAGWMNVTIVNETTGEPRRTVLNQTLGKVVYENDGTTIAYQGGGVWKMTDGGATMISPPEVHYRGTTLTLPLVAVNRTGPVDGDLVISDAGETERYYPNASRGASNPLRSGKVNVTVHSVYYEAWGRFFEARTSGNVSIDHDARTATLTLITPSQHGDIAGGIVSGAAGGTISISNGAVVDSYNSSVGGYGATDEKNTTIIAAGSVSVSNQGEIQGDLRVGRDVYLSNKAHVSGNVSYGGQLVKSNQATVDGWTANNASVATPRSAGPLIDKKRRILKVDGDNDNGETTAIDDARLNRSGGRENWELGAGQYYLSELSMYDDDELVLNTTNGDVSIYVHNDVSLSNEAVLRVVGNHTARVYVNGEMSLTNNANVSVPGEDAPQLWFYFHPENSVSFANQARFVGVVYGPGTESVDGVDIDVTNQVQVYGGLVGVVDSVPNGVGIHFDEALTQSRAFEQNQDLPQLTYLHVSVNTVNVSAS